MCRYHFWQRTGTVEYDRGRTPLQNIRGKLKYDKEQAKLPSIQRLHEYNKAVLKHEDTRIATLFWNGRECFVVEEYPNGTYKQSIAYTDRERLKMHYWMRKLQWQSEG